MQPRKFALAATALSLGVPALATESLSSTQADEVRAIVRDVLADAQSRTTLLQAGPSAGINPFKGKVYLNSGDGNHILYIGGHFQVRYGVMSGAGGTDTLEDGFQIRRSKLKLKGSVYDWDYKFDIVGARNDGNVYVETALVGTQITDGLRVDAGYDKLPFAFQELVSSSNQVAVDRAMATEQFTLNRGEQCAPDLQAGWQIWQLPCHGGDQRWEQCQLQ